MTWQAIEEYLSTQAARFEAELHELLRIPSVSAEPDRREELRRAADWIAVRLGRMGLRVETISTEGAPIVYAESPSVPSAPTALVYGHYDVQPVDPLDQWVTPPFEPAVREGRIYARGATDDKGQLLTHVNGAEAWLAVEGKLPVRLKFLIEGEEEIGSASLERLLRDEAERLACDVAVISDSAQFAPDQPAITYGLRGIACYELQLRGPRRDLHSGSFGGAVTSPALALARMLAGLVDQQGRIQIPGFYDDVVELSDREREELRRLPFDEQRFYAEIGVETGWGEAGYTPLERRWTRPSYDICGLGSGYQGEGFKTVLPATAGAKLSFRLVPRQDPEKISRQLRRRLEELCPPGVTFELSDSHGSPAMLVSLESPWIAAAARAIEVAFGRRPVFTREGGSIPIVAAMHQVLGADVLLLGWGQDDDNTHSPNERFSLRDYHRGALASARLWAELAALGTARSSAS